MQAPASPVIIEDYTYWHGWCLSLLEILLCDTLRLPNIMRT